MSPPAPQQLSFELPALQSLGRDDFIATLANQTALKMVESWPDWPSQRLLISGPAGSGKSHLAQIWMDDSGARLLGRSTLAQFNPAAGAVDAVCIENIEQLADHEEALFHLLNRCRAHGTFVLMTACGTPADWGFKIADLVSRLREMPRAVIEEPDDLLLKAVLHKLFADRQLSVDQTVVEYIIYRMDRSLRAAADLVEEIDAAALQAKRPINRQFVSGLFRDKLSPDQRDLF